MIERYVGATAQPFGIALSPDQQVWIATTQRRAVAALTARSLAFESAQLQRKCARIDRLSALMPDGPADYGPLIAQYLREMRKEGVSFVSVRLAEEDTLASLALQAQGFRAIETLLTLRRALTQPPPSADVERAGSGDAEACARVAAVAFTQDRFHIDPQIPDDTASRLKAEWARNDCRGRADTVFVVRQADRIVGFNACVRSDRRAVIDLIAVDPAFAGRGLGRRLVQGCLAHYGGQVECVEVGTQSRNVASLALYAATGFRVCASAVTLHAHLN